MTETIAVTLNGEKKYEEDKGGKGLRLLKNGRASAGYSKLTAQDTSCRVPFKLEYVLLRYFTRKAFAVRVSAKLLSDFKYDGDDGSRLSTGLLCSTAGFL